MPLLLFLLTSAVVFAQQPELEIEPIRTSITVHETIEAAAPGYITAVTADSLATRPGVNIDDRLRDIPGFTLFRRSSSLVAHPTTQGISLRGIGSSAAGRTLVLYDALPLNDPFGGWVYWSRVNPDAVDVVEISRGVSTSAWGDRSMGGVVSLFTPTPEGRRYSASAEGGGAGIADARGSYSDLFGKFGLSTFARAFRSEGYYVVPEEIRGSTDRRADVDFVVADLRLDYFGANDRLSFKTNLVAEQRQNGTVHRRNSSSIGTAGLRYQRAGLSVSGYHSRGALRSSFSFVNGPRNFERLTLLQKVVSEDSGAAVVWRRGSAKWNLMLGADTHRAAGLSRDTVVSTGFVRRPGGRLWQQGAFVQSDVAVGGRTRLYGGLRHDFTDRGNDFWSPRGGIAVEDGARRWRASVYRGFRSPTLNEFFRQFRVGNTTTFGNTGLRPETLVGGDAGLDWRTPAALIRTTFFWQSINDVIGNATISAPGAELPLRQRRNFREARGQGVEIELEKTFGRLRAEAAYLFVDADLDGRYAMPQTPRHQGTFRLLYSSGKTLISAGVRSYDAQFEDDLNLFILPGFATVQLLVQRRLGNGVSALLAVENLFNRTFVVGFSPTPTIGAPRLLRVGLKWKIGG